MLCWSCRLAPARDEDEEEQALVAQAAQQAKPSKPAPNSSRKRDKTLVTTRGQRPNGTNPYDLRGAPPQSTHMTGVEARIFQDYLSRCGSYSSYLDEGFVLVGFRQPSYFRPDMSKSACIYIGYLLTAGVLDAFKGTKQLSYPYYEYLAVRELQLFIDGADARELYEVVYPVIVLAMFEVCLFLPFG